MAPYFQELSQTAELSYLIFPELRFWPPQNFQVTVLSIWLIHATGTTRIRPIFGPQKFLFRILFPLVCHGSQVFGCHGPSVRRMP
jgi:hypothetical protein